MTDSADKSFCSGYDQKERESDNSWRVDETYIRVKGQWMYLYRAVDSKGKTIDFYLSKTRDHKAVKRFLKEALRSFYIHYKFIRMSSDYLF